MKTRIDAWEEKLPEDVRWELYSLAKPPSAEEIAAGRWWTPEQLQECYTPSHVALTSEMITKFMRKEVTEESLWGEKA